MRTLTTRLRPGQHRRRPARGFTLLELVLVGAVSSVLFLVLIRWVLTLGAASSVTLDNATAQRSADVARDAFAADMALAAPCALGEPSPLRTISPTQVSFTIRNGRGDAFDTDLVTWSLRQSGGTWALVRDHVVPSSSDTDPCVLTGASDSRSFYDHMAPVQSDRILAGDLSLRPAFYTVSAGQTVTDPAQAWGDCAAHQNADRCYADELGLNWLLTSPVDGGAPIAVARSYPFATTAEGLS